MPIRGPSTPETKVTCGDPEPAGQPAEHRIGEERRRRNDLCIGRLH